MSSRGRVVVVGGGIVGAACAEALVLDGWQVTLLERGRLGGGATAAGMGHVVVMDDSTAQLALTTYGRACWRARLAEWPDRVEVDPTGTLWIAADAREMEAVHTKAAGYARVGVKTEILGPADVARWEPNLRPNLAGGLRVPDDLVIYPPAAATYLAGQAVRHGAVLRESCKVAAIEHQAVHLVGGGRVEAEHIVVASGHWTPRLLPGWPIKPRRGHLIITDRHPGFARHQLIELGYLKSAHAVETASVAFNLQPRKTGQMLLGSSREYGVEDAAPDAAMLARMVERGAAYMPALPSLRALRAWTGFRAATPDKLPLIGPVPGHPGLWLASGHEGLGITTSLATANLLAAQLAGRRAEIDPTPYLPARMQVEADHAR